MQKGPKKKKKSQVDPIIFNPTSAVFVLQRDTKNTRIHSTHCAETEINETESTRGSFFARDK